MFVHRNYDLSRWLIQTWCHLLKLFTRQIVVFICSPTRNIDGQLFSHFLLPIGVPLNSNSIFVLLLLLDFWVKLKLKRAKLVWSQVLLEVVHRVLWQGHRKIVLLIFFEALQFILLVVISWTHVIGVVAGKEKLVPGILGSMSRSSAAAAAGRPEALAVGTIVAVAEMTALGSCCYLDTK